MPGSHCMPFVSQYSDCTEANQCNGCTRCTCNAEGTWSCLRVQECPKKPLAIDEPALDSALKLLYSQLNTKQEPLTSSPSQQSVPAAASNEDLLLDTNDEIEQKIVDLMNQPRAKRDTADIKVPHVEIDKKKNNRTVKFFNTVDELNEDTLHSSNISGTLQAAKISGIKYLSRRTGMNLKNNLNSTNGTEEHALQIEPKQLYNHIADNKIDEIDHTEDPAVVIKKDIEIGIVTNQTQKEKDAELSKILVNELKSGKEMIGDKNGPVMSNITFTPENDTLTAMAFIAGNLLNKLWSMQKDNSEEINMQEIERLKHEKIADLIELFKAPLTLRQEIVLKNALEKLSEAMNQNLDPKNLTLCENIAEVKRLLEDAKNSSWQVSVNANFSKSPVACGHTHDDDNEQKNVTVEAVSKINKVLELIKRFEGINKHLNDLKRTLDVHNTTNEAVQVDVPVLRTSKSAVKELSDDDHESLNMFGNLLSKITKLLLPNQMGKKLAKKITKQNIFTTDENKIKQKIKELFKYDLGNATLSIKDKLILDYLTKLESNPRILTAEEVTPKSRLSVEGDILLNLSEFFKIKSFVDLLKHLDTGKSINTETHRSPMYSAARSLEELTENYVETIVTTLAPLVRETTTEDQLIGEPVTDETVNQEPITEHAAKQNALEQEERQVEEEMGTEQAVMEMSKTTTETAHKLDRTKAKFKSHLKAILDDLVELQREYGIHPKEGEIRIADALPCIYNILQADKKLDDAAGKVNKSTTYPMQRIAAIFDSLKQELKTQTPKSGRRKNKGDKFAARPRSALVWERMVKAMNNLESRVSRRNERIVPSKTYEELKEMIESTESVLSDPNSYKTFAKFYEVPPAEKLLFLQTLYIDVKKYMEVLPYIRASLDNLQDATHEQKVEIANFVENAAKSINLDNKLITSLEIKNKTIPATVILKNFKSIASEENVQHEYFPKAELRKSPVPVVSYEKVENSYRPSSSGSFKPQSLSKKQKTQAGQKTVLITREEVLNQLVKNRIELYLQAKQERGDKADLKYNVATNILQNIELGNYEIARELYRVFAQTAESKPVVSMPQTPQKQERPKVKLEKNPKSPRESIIEKVPLVEFQDLLGNPKDYNILNRDFLLKQLLEFKNMKMVK